MVKIVCAQTTGMILWAEHKHKKGTLLGLKIDNQHTVEASIQITDNFTTSAGYTSGGSAYSAAAYVSGAAVSKFKVTVPTGDSISLGKDDLAGIEIIGRAEALSSVGSSNCIITAQYQLN